MSSRGNAEFNNSESDPTNDPDGETIGDDGENMVSSSKNMPSQDYAFEASRVKPNRDKHLRYRTRVFAAEYVIVLFSLHFSDSNHCFICTTVNFLFDPLIDQKFSMILFGLLRCDCALFSAFFLFQSLFSLILPVNFLFDPLINQKFR